MAHSFAQIPVPPGGKGRQYEIKWESRRGGGGGGGKVRRKGKAEKRKGKWESQEKRGKESKGEE